MNKIFLHRILLFLFIVLLPAWAMANDDEISHLLNFIEQSGCQFDRNGSVHDSKEARAHIEMKYDYAKKWIDSTEEFIKYTATKSSISGKLYYVVCDGQRIPSGEWLKQELLRYRALAKP
jgi:hypothetical protein